VTERHYEVTDPDAEDWYSIASQVVMIRDGVPEEIEGLTPDRFTLVAPTGNLVAWPVDPGTTVTDLDRKPRHIVPYGGATAWSDDGRWLAGIAGDVVWLLEATTGRLDELELSGARELYWSPDGRHLAVEQRCTSSSTAGHGSELRFYEDTGRWNEMYVEPCAEQRWIDWTPDGEGFARQSQEDDIDGLRVVSIENGQTGPFIERHGQAFRPEP